MTLLTLLDIAYMREAASAMKSKFVWCGATMGTCAGDPPVTCTRAKHSDKSKHYSHRDKVSWW